MKFLRETISEHALLIGILVGLLLRWILTE